MANLDTVPRSIGADFSVWEADSSITLTNVPWDNNYRDIVKFASQADFNKWIDAKKARNVDISGSRYYRINEPIYIEIPFTESYGFNYVRVLNPAQQNVGNVAMYSYYFITNVRHAAPGVTELTVQLDVWQTFGYRAKFGNVFIERGHIGVANEDGFDNWGRDFLTLAEGLDTGSDLKIVHERKGNIRFSPDFCSIMVITTTDFEAEPGDVKKPQLRTSRGSKVNGMPSGAAVWFFQSVAEFQNFLGAYTQYPWIVQGIQSITAIPDLTSLGYKLVKTAFPKYANGAYKLNEGTDRPRGRYSNLWENWRDTVMSTYIPRRYRMLKKLLTSPYSAIEMTYQNGAPVVLKPELWASDDAPIVEKLNILAPGSRLVSYPERYNAISDKTIDQVRQPSDGKMEHYYDGGEYLSVSTMISNFPTFAVVANSGTLALANQAHSLAQQYKATDWAQQKVLQGAQTSYDQANSSIDAGARSSLISRNQAIDMNHQANQNAWMQTLSGGGKALAHGDIGGAVFGVVDNIIAQNDRNARTNIGNQAALSQQNNTQNQDQYIANTNFDLAKFAARGDYMQSNAAINAKVQDTNMTAPFTAGQAGGDSFVFSNDRDGIQIRFRFKILPPAELKAVCEFWLRYGYAVRQFAVPPASLQVMTKFTYWKFTETYLVATDTPEFIKQMIRGIFEKGVTVWASPDYIGSIDPSDNAPLPGITLGNKL